MLKVNHHTSKIWFFQSKISKYKVLRFQDAFSILKDRIGKLDHCTAVHYALLYCIPNFYFKITKYILQYGHLYIQKIVIYMEGC